MINIQLEDKEVNELLEVLIRERRRIAFHQDYGKVSMYERLISKIQPRKENTYGHNSGT